MTKNNKSVSLALCPYLWRWATEIGTVEIGHYHQTRSFIPKNKGQSLWLIAKRMPHRPRWRQ